MGKHAYARSYTSAQGRHRRPSDNRSIARNAMAAGGLTVGALVVGQLAAPGAFAASADDFARLRMCESGGNYSTDTGNGYYGAYQFSLGTWRGIGYSGKPSDAAPSTQDSAARKLQARSGWGQWPACSRKLGLGSSHSHHSSSTSSTSRGFSAASSSRAVVVHPASGPVILTTDYAGVWRADVRDLQTKLNLVGFTLTVDGHYGQETAAIIRRFQTNTGLEVDGQVGPETATTIQRQLLVVAHLMALTARV
jgi:hypothetical protein